MPKLAPRVLPAFHRRERRNLAVVTLDELNLYFGPWNSPESKEAYRRVTGEWQANGRQRPDTAEPLTAIGVLGAFLRHACTFYRHLD
ncbi:MAG: Integrase [Phycisphaerales bacterium]|nr:Integrase [Phycisphaerales bacterium]